MEELLLRLNNKNIDVAVKDGELELNIPRGFDATDLIQEIKSHKQDLIDYLQEWQRNDFFQEIPHTQTKPHYVLSSAQRRQYFLYEYDKQSVNYNLPRVIALRGKLDRRRLEKAFNILVSRHETLRTSFEVNDGEVVQVINKEPSFTIKYEKVKPEDLDMIIKGFIRPFDLADAPLFRVLLVQLEPEFHYILMDIHHIICDGVSMDILTKESMQLYNRQWLPPLRLQYKDYAAWQQGEQQRQILGAQKQFWLKQFEKEFSVLNLPTDFKRPTNRRHVGAIFLFSLSNDSTTALRTLGHSVGATFFMTVLSVINVLLSKLCNQEDIIIGTPSAGREHSSLEGLIGMFVNTVLLRNYPKGSLAFNAFLSQVRRNSLACFDNQAYQYEELIDAMEVPRDTSHNPLFDVMYTFQKVGAAKRVTDQSTLTMEPYNSGHVVSKFDLCFDAIDVGDRLDINISYSTDLFKETTICRFAEYFKRIVDLVTFNPGIKLEQVDILSEAERHRLLYHFNDTTSDFPGNKTVIDLFEEQVARNPSHVAISCEGVALSYGDFNSRVNHLAAGLQERGIGRGAIVGLLSDRSIEMMTGLYAIMKTGAAYLPIDPSYPHARISYLLEDSGAELLLASEKNMPGESFNIKCMNLEEVGIGTTTEFEHKASPEGLAYVIYTSGSTGNPKGVMIEHRSLMNRLHWMGSRYPIGKDDVILQKTPIVFDVSVWELFWWSQCGAQLRLLTPGGEKYPETICHEISAHHITTIHFVPSMFSVFLEYVNSRQDLSHLTSLKWVFSSGEALSIDHVKKFKQKFSKEDQASLINLYGPTEATIDVTCFDDFDSITDHVVPIGQPISNTSIYILDDNGKLQPMGTPGELCIGGVNLARGYLNNEALTTSKFIKNPFMYGERLYKTGDLARWLPDGNIEYLGRMDDQVKIRGYRIELGEIESCLVSHNEIIEAIVCSQGSGSNGYLIGYYVSNQKIHASELASFVSSHLPEYMVPDFYVHLARIPLTPNGKVNKKVLPQPKKNEVHEDQEGGPRFAIEYQLIEAWQKVLNLENIGINDNFFKLGGNSLTAISMVNAMNRQLGVSLSTRIIFEHQTIKQVCTEIQRLESYKGNFELGLANNSHKPKMAYLTENPELPSLFFIPPLGGILPPTSLVGIIDMAVGLSDTVSLVSLQPSPLMPELLDQLERGEEIGLTSESIMQSIEDIAIEIVDHMMKAQDSLSYSVGGFCTGCVLTVEIAKVLERKGKSVDKMILIDPPVWVESIQSSQVKMSYSRREIVNYVANDLGWDTPEFDMNSLADQLESVPLKTSWKVCKEYMQQLNMFDRQFEEDEVKKSFERKFYNDLVLQFYFANRPYSYPDINVEEGLILATRNLYPMLKEIAVNKFEGQVMVAPIPAEHHELFQGGFLSQWTDTIADFLCEGKKTSELRISPMI